VQIGEVIRPPENHPSQILAAAAGNQTCDHQVVSPMQSLDYQAIKVAYLHTLLASVV